MTRSALVTGACGFIGRHVARRLADEGWHVTGLGHGLWVRESWQQWGIADWHAASVTLETLVAHAGKPDLIVHCAGSGSVGFSMTNPYQDFERTVGTISAVLEYVRVDTPQTRVVYPSSAGVYGAVARLPIREGDPLAPVSLYGVHKRIVEELCAAYAHQYELPVALVRLFSVYGNGLRKQLLWEASEKIARDERQFFGSGAELRDWLHVEDAARLLVRAADHASGRCPIVNGGFGVGVSVLELLTELFARSGRDDEPLFSGRPRSGDPHGYVADIALARAWGWQPTIHWRDGLRDYAAWYRNRSSC